MGVSCAKSAVLRLQGPCRSGGLVWWAEWAVLKGASTKAVQKLTESAAGQDPHRALADFRSWFGRSNGVVLSLPASTEAVQLPVSAAGQGRAWAPAGHAGHGRATQGRDGLGAAQAAVVGTRYEGQPLSGSSPGERANRRRFTVRTALFAGVTVVYWYSFPPLTQSAAKTGQHSMHPPTCRQHGDAYRDVLAVLQRHDRRDASVPLRQEVRCVSGGREIRQAGCVTRAE